MWIATAIKLNKYKGNNMDFGIGNPLVAFWVAWNYWSIVPVAITILFGVVIWKAIITPKEYQERVAREQSRENDKLSQPKIRRILITCMIGIFSIMASILFVVSLFMMFK